MGRSGKLTSPTASPTARYLDAWFDTLGLDRVFLTGHDWGGVLTLGCTTRHPGRVLGITFVDNTVKPIAWAEPSPQARKRSEATCAPGTRDKRVLDQDLFVR